MKKILLIVLLLVSGNAQAAYNTGLVTNQGYDLIVCAGQSQAAGRGAYDPLYDIQQSPYIYSWDASASDVRYQTIINQTNPLYQTEGYEGTPTINANSIGPCGNFAQMWQQSLPPGRRVLIVPVAVGQTGLVNNNPLWNPLTSGSLYTNAIAQTNAALAAAQAQFPNGVNQIAVWLWHQGENDDVNQNGPVNYSTYATYLDALINGLRSGTNSPNSLFIIGSFNPYQEEFGYNGAVPLAQRDAPRRNYLTAFAPRIDGLTVGSPFSVYLYNSPTECTAIAALGLTCPRTPTGDSVHYSGYGARMLGMQDFNQVIFAKANVAGGPAPACAPTLTAPNSYATAIHLLWNYCQNPATRVSNASVQYRVTGSGSWTTYNQVTSNGMPVQNGFPDINVLGLTPSTSYDFRVAQINEAGTGPYSNIVTVSTAASVATITVSPRDYYCVDVNSTSASCTWSAPNTGDTPTSYTMRYLYAAQLGGTAGATTTVTGYSPSAYSGTINLPWAGTQYNVGIQAVDSAGTGPVAVLSYVTTSGTQIAPNAPTAVTFVSAGPSSLTVSWTAPASGYPVYQYSVQACVHSTSTCTASTTVNNALSGTVSGLTSNTSYDISVASINNGGTSTYSSSITDSTSGFDYLVADVGATPNASCDLARAQVSTQSGPVIQVTRSSDNTTMDIGLVNGTLDTTTLLNFVGTTSSSQGYVSKCYDPVSGRTVTLSQATQSLMPRIVLNGALVTTPNGTPGMQIYGGTEYLASASVTGFPGAADFTVSYVYKPVAGSNGNNTIVSSTDNATSLAFGQLPTNFVRYYINGTQIAATTGSLTSTQNHVVVYTYTNSSKLANAWVDNVQVVTNGALTNASNATLPELGNWSAHTGALWPSPGPIISEFDIWLGVLNSTQISAIHTSSSAFFGTP